MNQSVLFPDLQEWNCEQQTVLFPAQVQGVNVECVIGLERLSVIAGKTIKTAAEVMLAFDEYRFDIEEEAELLIVQEVFDELGRVILS